MHDDYRMPDGRTLGEWRADARKDDCLERMVPSDLRLILMTMDGLIDRALRAEAELAAR